MKQPEAKFKAKIIDLHRKAETYDRWFTYLSPGGPGQKQGIPDLVFGDASHGIIWVEAKVGLGVPKLRPLQKKTIQSLVRCGAAVVIPVLNDPALGVVSLWVMSEAGVLTRVGGVGLGVGLWPALWSLRHV